jgi:hypothetical protein
MSEKTDKATAAIHKAMLADLAVQGTTIFNALVRDTKNAVIPEQIFVNYFLPYLAGLVPITNDVTVISDWISVAGTAMSEVDVIDQHGKVLFTVPKLLDTNIINIVNRERGNAFQEIYAQFNLHSNNIPIVGDRYLNGALDKKIDSMSQESNAFSNNSVRWNEILTRYGLILNTTVSIKESSQDDDDVEY